MSKGHPELIQDYFESIDTLDKAYWLGFLYADGCIEVDKRKKDTKRLIIKLNVNDEWLIDRFIRCLKLNDNKKQYRDNRKYVLIRLGCKKLTNDLIKHGCVPRKSKLIELPNLANRSLYLALLLGYYDGDGTAGTTKITSGSEIFIKQIKKYFKIPNKIMPKGKKLSSIDFCLGVELFNEMMRNYENSLPRKRKKFCTEDERIKRIKANSWNEGTIQKFVIERSELEKLVWEMPIKNIVEMLDVSNNTVIKRCKKYNINRPHQSFWQKQKSNRIR